MASSNQGMLRKESILFSLRIDVADAEQEVEDNELALSESKDSLRKYRHDLKRAEDAYGVSLNLSITRTEEIDE